MPWCGVVWVQWNEEDGCEDLSSWTGVLSTIAVRLLLRYCIPDPSSVSCCVGSFVLDGVRRVANGWDGVRSDLGWIWVAGIAGGSARADFNSSLVRWPPPHLGQRLCKCDYIADLGTGSLFQR